jgi:hypothetical protein
MCNATNPHFTIGEQYKTIEEKMKAIANISFPKKPEYNDSSTQTVPGSRGSLDNQNTGDKERLQVCPKLLKCLLSKTSNSSAPGLDGIGWQELKIWYLIDSIGLCELINYLITTGPTTRSKTGQSSCDPKTWKA